jgi:hypothetical protein
MHCNDDLSFTDVGLWTRVENTHQSMRPDGAVGVHKKAGTIAEERLTHWRRPNIF